jgi:hypothetical protein
VKISVPLQIPTRDLLASFIKTRWKMFKVSLQKNRGTRKGLYQVGGMAAGEESNCHWMPLPSEVHCTLFRITLSF